MSYPRHQPPPSAAKRAEFVGTYEDVDVWWDPLYREYWYNCPGMFDVWCEPGAEPNYSHLKPGFPLAEAHRILLNP